MPKKSNKKRNHDICGLIFLIETSSIYIINDNGIICNITGEENELNQLSVNQVYKIQNIYFNSKDKRNYLLYDTTKQTKFIEIHEKDIFKNYSILKFIFLDDIREEKNAIIKVNNNLMYIKDKIQYISSYNNDNSCYYLEEIELIILNKSKYFNLFIYKGQINNINCSLNEQSETKCYEVIYLSKEKKNLPNELRISGYTIKDYDKFSCTNRIRFNIMNVKKENSLCKYYNLLTSYEIIFLINEKNVTTKYGIFNVKSFNKILRKNFNINNYSFMSYLQDFWNNYNQNNIQDENYNISYFKTKKNEFTKQIKGCDLENFINLKNIDIYTYYKQSLDNNNCFIFFRNYCFYNNFDFMCQKSLYDVCVHFFNLLKKITNFSYFDKIRILLTYTNLTIEYGQNPAFININNLPNDHPYKISIKLQKDIITNINETSNIFYPIIQFNSKILEMVPDNLWSYLIGKINFFKNSIKGKPAYTLSLENIEEIKNHLLNLQEDFFFTLQHPNSFNAYGLYYLNTGIMAINQFLICPNIFSYSDYTSSTNFAFSISLIFSLERMCHGKENLCNPGIDSPTLYFNINFKKDNIGLLESYKNINKGEAGRIFETFIAEPILINIMKNNLCFGKYLNYKYFIGDFKEIKEAAFKIFSGTYYYKSILVGKIIICILCILSYIIFFYLLTINCDINLFLFYIISILTFIILVAFIYKFNNNETFLKLNMFNYNTKDKDEQKEEKFIYPDDYPIQSNSF